jgi:hypothetical protein
VDWTGGRGVFYDLSNGKCTMGEVRNTEAYKILVGNPERKRRLGRPGGRREDNIKAYVNKEGASKCTEFMWSRKGSRDVIY